MSRSNPADEVLNYWQKALMVWFLAFSVMLVWFSIWALQDTPTQAPATTRSYMPAPAVATLTPEQTTAYLHALAAYTAARPAVEEVAPASPRLKAYKEVVVDGLLAFVEAVLTVLFATVVGVKSLSILEKYLSRKLASNISQQPSSGTGTGLPNR